MLEVGSVPIGCRDLGQELVLAKLLRARPHRDPGKDQGENDGGELEDRRAAESVGGVRDGDPKTEDGGLGRAQGFLVIGRSAAQLELETLQQAIRSGTTAGRQVGKTR